LCLLIRGTNVSAGGPGACASAKVSGESDRLRWRCGGARARAEEEEPSLASSSSSSYSEALIDRSCSPHCSRWRTPPPPHGAAPEWPPWRVPGPKAPGPRRWRPSARSWSCDFVVRGGRGGGVEALSFGLATPSFQARTHAQTLHTKVVRAILSLLCERERASASKSASPSSSRAHHHHHHQAPPPPSPKRALTNQNNKQCRPH
jgi:hypothetical protein